MIVFLNYKSSEEEIHKLFKKLDEKGIEYNYNQTVRYLEIDDKYRKAIKTIAREHKVIQSLS